MDSDSSSFFQSIHSDILLQHMPTDLTHQWGKAPLPGISEVGDWPSGVDQIM